MEKNRLKKSQYIGKNRHLSLEKKTAPDVPPHTHDYFEIEVILEGTGVHILNNRECEIQKGDILILTPTDYHQVKTNGDLLLWNVSFDEATLDKGQLEALLRRDTKSNISICNKTLYKVDRVLELLLEEWKDSGNIKPLFEYFLSLIIQSERTTSKSEPIKEALLYIGTHFRENPSLTDAAEAVHLSPVYFGSIFKKATGETYINYLNSLKVDYAKTLLESGVSVTEACYSSGFGSLSGFLYTFKKKTGLSPEAYKTNTR